MASFAGKKLEDGRARLVRHGHLPEREILTGVGPVPVKVPRVRDRGAGEDKILAQATAQRGALRLRSSE